MHLMAPNLRKSSIKVKIFLLPRFWQDIFSCCVSNIPVGRGQEAGGCLNLSQSAIHKNWAGGEGTLSHRQEHAEPWELHHQQRLLPDFHPGLFNKAYPEWWVPRAAGAPAPHSRVGICVLALLPSPCPFHGAVCWMALCGWGGEPSKLFSVLLQSSWWLWKARRIQVKWNQGCCFPYSWALALNALKQALCHFTSLWKIALREGLGLLSGVGNIRALGWYSKVPYPYLRAGDSSDVLSWVQKGC